MLNLRAIVAAAILTFTAAPVLAQAVDLDGWDFNSRPELAERLEETRENLNEKIKEAQEVDNQGLVHELQQARKNIDKAIDNVQAADEENWDETIGAVETDLEGYNYYDYGVWDDDYWYDDPWVL